LVYLQNKAIENHHIILDLFKKFYNYIILSQKKNNIDLKIFNIDKFFESLSYLKHEAIHTYQEIIEKYPDDKVCEHFFFFFFIFFFFFLSSFFFIYLNFNIKK